MGTGTEVSSQEETSWRCNAVEAFPSIAGGNDLLLVRATRDQTMRSGQDLDFHRGEELVIVDNSGTSGCVAVDKVEIVPVGSAADGPAAGCTDTSAINYDAAADSDDGSCLFVGGRGLLRQHGQWQQARAVQEDGGARA